MEKVLIVETKREKWVNLNKGKNTLESELITAQKSLVFFVTEPEGESKSLEQLLEEGDDLNLNLNKKITLAFCPQLYSYSTSNKQ